MVSRIHTFLSRVFCCSSESIPVHRKRPSLQKTQEDVEISSDKESFIVKKPNISKDDINDESDEQKGILSIYSNNLKPKPDKNTEDIVSGYKDKGRGKKNRKEIIEKNYGKVHVGKGQQEISDVLDRKKKHHYSDESSENESDYSSEGANEHNNKSLYSKDKTRNRSAIKKKLQKKNKQIGINTADSNESEQTEDSSNHKGENKNVTRLKESELSDKSFYTENNRDIFDRKKIYTGNSKKRNLKEESSSEASNSDNDSHSDSNYYIKAHEKGDIDERRDRAMSIESFLKKDFVDQESSEQDSVTEVSCAIGFHDKKDFNRLLSQKLKEILRKEKLNKQKKENNKE